MTNLVDLTYKTLEDLVSGVNKVIYGIMILGLVVGVYLKKKDILNLVLQQLSY